MWKGKISDFSFSALSSTQLPHSLNHTHMQACTMHALKPNHSLS